MNKIIKNLISKKNEHLKKGEIEKAEQIRLEIKKLKRSSESIKSSAESKASNKKSSKQSQIIPSIPQKVIINNIDITDNLYELMASKYVEESKEIYMSIIRLCESRKNYINTVLKKNINSYEIDGRLELNEKTKCIIESLKKCKSLKQSEIESRISKLKDLVSSYEVDQKKLTLKSTLYDEIVYINEIINLAYKLFTGIKRQLSKPKPLTMFNNIHITKKQQEIIEGIYIRKVPECNISDYLFSVKYYLDKKEYDKDDIIYLVKYFVNKYNNNESDIYYIENFQKIIKKAIKDFKKSDKKTINSIMWKINVQKNEIIEEDYRFEIILYFIHNNYEEYVEEILNRMPDIANSQYNGESIVINIFKELLNEYNNILQMRYGYNEKIISLMEKVFIKLYSINDNQKDKIELITQEYIQQLKQINCSTVSKNMVLFRINKIRENMGVTSKIDLPEIQSENYKYLDFYYKEELSNPKRKYVNNSILLDKNNTVTYSIIRNDESMILRVNVVDLTPYFMEETGLYELAIKNCIDIGKMKKYAKFALDRENPSITFEFHFYRGILKESIIYDSIVKPIKNDSLNFEYNELLNYINIIDVKEGFNDLIKVSLEHNKREIPYIVKYNLEDSNYHKIITDLNYLFSKLSKSDVDNIYQLLNRNNQNYGLSNDIVGKYSYSINVLNPMCNFYDILMQKIIRSYYNRDVNLNINTVEQYVKKKNK